MIIHNSQLANAELRFIIHNWAGVILYMEYILRYGVMARLNYETKFGFAQL